MSIMTALSVAQGIGGFIDASNKARQQEAYYQQNRINAAQARDLQIQGLQKRAVQISEQYSQKKQDLAIAALKREGAMITASGESGLAGQTEAIKLSQAESDKLKGLDTFSQQANALFDDIEVQKLGLNAQMLQRIRSVQRGVKPSLGMAVLSTASSAIAAEIDYGDSNIFGLGGDSLGSQTAAFTPVTYNPSSAWLNAGSNQL
jgi:hypothetical protein